MKKDPPYEQCLDELRSLIPAAEYEAVLSQEYCELDDYFLGFVLGYQKLSQIIPKEKIIIDFGCYLAAQSYFFTGHRQYIGVDIVELRRFTPPNAVHHISTIQDFLKTRLPELFLRHNKSDFFAICSYVPAFDATAQVRREFPNIYCYYP